MRFKILFLFVFLSTVLLSQNINIPGFGNIPYVQKGDLYSMDFGKLGRFNFSGSIDPLSLTASVDIDDLKTFPGYPVMKVLGMSDIELTVTTNDFGITANIDDKFKDDIVDEVKKIDLIAPILETVLNTFEMRESSVSLTFDKHMKLFGEIDFNIYLFGKKLPIPNIKGEINPEAIVKKVVEVIKDEALKQLYNVGKIVAEAAVEAGKAISGAVDDALKLAKTASRHATHSKSHCDHHCVPGHAGKLSGPVLYASNMAITKFYDKVIPVIKKIEGSTPEQTKQLRSKYLTREWGNIIVKIDKDWAHIRGDKSYIRFYVMPSSATNGGHIFRRKIDEYKKQHVDFRDRIWNRMMSEKELIIKNKDVYFVKSVSQNKWWDLPGFHYNAGRKNAKLGLYKKDRHKGLFEGADRFIKVIRTGNPNVVFLQPQHSYYVLCNHNSEQPGASLTLTILNNTDNGQMFEMKPVRRKKNTYYLLHLKTGLYITAEADGTVKLQKRKKSKDQQWRFEDAGNAKFMAAPDPNYRFRVVNAKANKGWDIAGAMRDTKGKGTEIKLWDQDDWPDRFIGIEPHNVGDETYFYIRVLHHDYVVDVTGASLNNGAKALIWDKNNQLNQQFKFIYAGSPLTYFIQDRNSGKVLDASLSNINKNGCAVQTWDYNGGDQQKWKLVAYNKWQIPANSRQNFNVKAAYTNNEFWDVSGSTSGKGSKIQNYALDAGSDRLFRVQKTGDHSWVNILGVQSGMMVDVPNNTNRNGTQIQLWPKNGADAQKFGLEFTGASTFVIVTKRRKCIDINGDPYNGTSWRDDGRSVQVNNHGYTQDRHWQLIYADGPNRGEPYVFSPVNPESSKEEVSKRKKVATDPMLGKTYIIQSAINFGKNNGGCWDIPGGKNPALHNGKNVEMWEYNGGSDQNYTVLKGTINGYYKLAPSNSYKYRVNVDGGRTNNGTNVELWEKNSNRRQNFRFVHLGGGRFKIYDSNGRAICLSGRSSNNGSNIHIWEDHNGPWMEWYLLDPKTRRPYVPK